MTTKATTRSSSRTSTSTSSSTSATPQAQKATSADAATTRTSTSVPQPTVRLQPQPQKQKAQDQPASGLPPQKKQKKDSEAADTDKDKKQQPSYATMERNKFSESLGHDTVIVKVGKEQTPLIFHKDRLCAVPEFFKKAFNGKFKEANERVMHFEDVNIRVFDGFAEWVYHGCITLPDDDTTAGKAVKLDLLVDIYLFGDRILCQGLKNGVMDEIQDVMYKQHDCPCCTQIFFSAANVKKIFENTLDTENSRIRRYCAALVSHCLFMNHDMKKVEDYFKVTDFLKELSAYQRLTKDDIHDWDERGEERPVPSDDPRIRGMHWARDSESEHIETGHPICFFHVHDVGENCTSKSNFIKGIDDDSDEEWRMRKYVYFEREER